MIEFYLYCDFMIFECIIKLYYMKWFKIKYLSSKQSYTLSIKCVDQNLMYILANQSEYFAYINMFKLTNLNSCIYWNWPIRMFVHIEIDQSDCLYIFKLTNHCLFPQPAWQLIYVVHESTEDPVLCPVEKLQVDDRKNPHFLGPGRFPCVVFLQYARCFGGQNLQRVLNQPIKCSVTMYFVVIGAKWLRYQPIKLCVGCVSIW